MKKFWVWASSLLLLSSFGAGTALAYDATEADLYNALELGLGEGAYIYYDYTAEVGVLGFRTKPWGTNGNLFDSGQSSYGLSNNEFAAETLTGLNPSTAYDVYVLAGGKVNTGANESWGVQVGFASGDYTLQTADIGDDASLTKFNLGNYYNEDMGVYPYREASSINDACMYVVYVGSVMSDASGNLNVYAADVEDYPINGVTGFRTWFDGFVVVPPQAANNPDPADGTTGMDASADETLSWMAGFDPNNVPYTDFYVYFGTSADDMELLNTTVTHATSISAGVTEYNNTYYWQVEEVEQDENGSSLNRNAGDPNNIFSPVWSFETIYYIPRITDIEPSTDKVRVGETVDITTTYTTHVDYPVTGVVWYHDGVAIDVENDADYSAVVYETESTLTIDINAATFGSYTCVVNNGYGSSDMSDEVAFTELSVWTWTGDAGTTSWIDAGNWDMETAPTVGDDVLISAGTVDIDVEGEFYYSSNITLEGTASLVCPEGKRFGGGMEYPSVTTISDDATLDIGLANYYILAKNYPSVMNQTGGEFNATINRGFIFTDNDAAYGTYLLSGGTMNVSFDGIDGTASTAIFSMMGRNLSTDPDYFLVDGGAASFTNTSGSARPIYIKRDSVMQIDSGSAAFTDFVKVSIGFEDDGTTSSLIVNGGQLDMIHTPLVIGDNSEGVLEVTGGVVNLDSTASDAVGIQVGASAGSQGVVNQTGGQVLFNATEFVIGSPSGTEFSSAEYVISGGSLVGSGAIRLNSNAVLQISGSAATAIEAQELTVGAATAS